MTGKSSEGCIAFKHLNLAMRETNAVRSDVLIMVPCREPIEHKSRFCRRHNQAFREILLGILEEGNSIGYRER